ncbi:phosphotransferase family protein [Niallia taxi]|uniref:phosphotransferase family protein n=1 Tax=Niallia taxi TaxID=2499688 RepID=UPI00254ACD63|nr:aminoglycoside phosphotransferase family protein [Niallia taxi]MDK8641897.1 aminoglycoside phosphotransferase family protein [Niallia taxi]MED4054577.1 aminoglycoside phosphotransferase family protein [Niallia taxi]MED4122005.1 aminoglycoside phosphotransferase family protein [Niallia taxi]
MELGSLIATGNTADIFMCNNKIVKLFKEYLPPNEALSEATKQKFAYSCGLNVPKVFEVTKVNGTQAIIMEHINGETLGQLIQDNIESVEHYISILVNVQNEIHTVKINSDEIESMAEKLNRQINSARTLGEEQKIKLLSRLRFLQYKSKLCHGDLHPYNLLVSNETISIIDWVDASAGDPRADVCRSYLLFSSYSHELAELYLRSYCDKTNLSEKAILEWLPIIAGARLNEKISPQETKRLEKIVGQFCANN